MAMNLRKDPITNTLKESERIIAPDSQTYERILGAVLEKVDAPDVVTYQEAAERLEGLETKKLYLFPRRVAACAAGLAAVAAAFLLAPNLPGLGPLEVLPEGDNNLVVIPNEKIPLASMPGATTRTEVQPDGDGGHTMKVYDTDDNEAALLRVASNREGWPVLETCLLVENQAGFLVSDSSSDIHWESAYGIDQDGNRMDALEILPQDRLLVFDIPQSSMELFFQDMDGNWISCTLTMQEK